MTRRAGTRAARIAQMEADGTMDRRRDELRAWFEAHPSGSPVQAVAGLGFTFADHMNAVADSVWQDMHPEAAQAARRNQRLA